MATTAQLIDILACDKVDSNGDPLSGYKVRTYASDGTTPANVWETRAKTTPKAQFVLDATGYAEVYGDNTYIINIWADTADPDVDTPYLTIGPVTYSFDSAGDVTGDLTGDVKAIDGTVVLDSGTNGTDATLVADVTGDLTGDVTGNTTGNVTGNVTGGVVAGVTGSVYNVDEVNIGDWNMNTTPSVNVAHGIANYKKIRRITATIISDDDTSYTPLDTTLEGGAIGASTTPQGGNSGYSASTVTLERLTGGLFQAVGYSTTSFNRGIMTIWYID